MVKKKYRVKLYPLEDGRKSDPNIPYDQENFQIESDGSYYNFGTNKKRSEEFAKNYKERVMNKEGWGESEEYYRRQRSNRIKNYSTNKPFDIKDLVF